MIEPIIRSAEQEDGNTDNQGRIHFREVVHVTIKSLVIINGEEVEIKDLEDKEAFADSVNNRILSERNYVVEKPA